VSYLRSFAPWIAFAVVPAADWKWAALFALAISLVGIMLQVRAGLPADAQIIEIGSAVYFGALTVFAFVDPKTPLHAYTACLAAGALGLIACVSLAIGKPFTLGIAKQTTPRQLWDKPMFYRVNVIITSVWAASFVVSCVILALLAHSSAAGRSTVQVAAFVIPLVFTVRYVARVRERAQSAPAMP
jgi:prepilin signal peptidase PulO-like enzyme (type II secretory pathway)